MLVLIQTPEGGGLDRARYSRGRKTYEDEEDHSGEGEEEAWYSSAGSHCEVGMGREGVVS